MPCFSSRSKDYKDTLNELHLVEGDLKLEHEQKVLAERKLEKVMSDLAMERNTKRVTAEEVQQEEMLNAQLVELEQEVAKWKETTKHAQQALDEAKAKIKQLNGELLPKHNAKAKKDQATQGTMATPGMMDINVGVAIVGSAHAAYKDAGAHDEKSTQPKAMYEEPDRVLDMRLYHFLCGFQHIDDKKALHLIGKYGRHLVNILDSDSASLTLQKDGLMRMTAMEVKERWTFGDARTKVMSEKAKDSFEQMVNTGEGEFAGPLLSSPINSNTHAYTEIAV